MSEGGRPRSASSLAGHSLGRYRLERLLGEGGMGVVYAARHEELGKLAAVKVLNERYDESEEVRARFLREGQATSRIRHPNIVDVYDVGVDAGRAFLVMELLEGEDLRRLILREGPLSPQRTADLLVPVVSALAVAHDIGVVHRDLKPDNIFLSVHRKSVAPKVLDFGISKVIDQEKTAALTGTGTLLGTPHYMSPEQAQAAKNIDARTDQYSVGVILYECVTCRRPMEEPSLYQLIHRIVHGDFAPPRQLNPNLPASFEQVILTAMARDPAERFPSTRALGLALLPFASERVRANHAGELAHEEAHLPTVAAPAPRQPPELHTTLGESVHERDSSRKPSGKRVPVLPLAAGLLVAGFVAAVMRQSSKPTPPGRIAASALGTSVVPSAPAAGGSTAQRTADPGPRENNRKRLVSDPAGAVIWMGGKSVGQAPWSVEVAPGSTVDVELGLAGFETEKRKVAASDPEEIVVKLVQKPPPAKPGTGKHAPKADRPELAPR